MFHDFFIGKTFLKGLTAPDEFVLANHDKAWMDTNLMQLWVKKIWLQYTTGKESLLVLDRFQAHMVDEVNSSLLEGNSITCLIPGGCTSVLQPLDVSLNKPFKSHIQKEWLNFMEDSVTMQENEQDKDGYLSEDLLASSNESDGGKSNDEIGTLLIRSKTKRLKPVKPAS